MRKFPTHSQRAWLDIILCALFAVCAMPAGASTAGEDPQKARLRQADKEREAVNAHGSDQERWAATMHSDTARPERLQRELIRATGLTMRLDPKLGHLVFERPGVSDTFEIATPAGTASATCPKFTLNILDARAGHVLIKKNCPMHQMEGDRIAMSSDYYLYDTRTAIMRNIWTGHAGAKGEKFPSAKPDVLVKRTADGYRFNWTGVMPNDPDNKQHTFNNAYQWMTDKTNGKPTLRCTDLSAPNGTGVENALCEGGILPLIANTRK